MKIIPIFIPKFSPSLGLGFSQFFCSPVGVESVSERANPTLLFQTPFWIHFLRPLFIPFLPLFFIPFLPRFIYHFYPCFSYHSYPQFSYPPFFILILTLFFIPILPPFLYHQPQFLQQCVNIVRPCPQCKNLDNKSANFMNIHLLFMLLAYSTHILKMCSRCQALSPV